MRPLSTLACLSLLLTQLGANPASAEPATSDAPAATSNEAALPDVALSAHRRETPIEQITGSVTVIGRAEIERRGWRTLTDVLNEVPGLQVVQAGGLGAQTSIFTRGTESDHTLILIDGIEVGDPSIPGGVFDPSHMLTIGIERVEILRGPQATMYGSDALGGVIQVVSRTGRGPTRANAWAEAGGFNTLQQAVGVRGGDRAFDYSLDYSNLSTSGISTVGKRLGGREDDGYGNRTLSARFGSEVADGIGFTVLGRLVDSDRDLDPFVEDRDARETSRQLYARAEGRLSLFDGIWQQKLGIAITDHDRKLSNDADDVSARTEKSTWDGSRLKLDWIHHLQLVADQTTTFGFETKRETIRARGDSFNPATLDASMTRTHASGRSSAAFVQQQFTCGDRVFGSFGGRLDHHDEFGSHLTYRANSAYVHPSTGTRIHGGFGTGFKAPTLDDLFGSSIFEGASEREGVVETYPSTFSGNPALQPEKSRSFEIGIEQPFLDGRARAGVTLFQNRIRNLIQANSGFDSLENVGRVKTEGVESTLTLNLHPRISIRANHTYTMAENQSGDEDLLRRPAHMATLVVEGRPTDASTLTWSTVYTGHRKDGDAITFERVSRPGYALTNVAATLQIDEHWKLFGRIDNLFDRKYDDPEGFSSSGLAGYFGVSSEY